MKFLVSTVLALTLLLFLGGGQVAAQYYQPSEDKYEIVVDKLIKLNDNFVDNISASQKVFVNGEIVDFKIKIHNSGNSELKNITVKDKLPEYLSVMFHPGVYSKENKTVTWEIDKLVAGETREYFIKARIVDYKLTGETGQTNFAEGKNEKTYDDDRASYVIGKKEMPVTGGNVMILGSLLSLGLMSGGVFLRKYSRGY